MKFKEGHSYKTCDCSVDAVKVIKRTAKTVTVQNRNAVWRMRIREDDLGEYVIDSSVPERWRGMFTYRAVWEDVKPIKLIWSENNECLVVAGFTLFGQHYTWSEENEMYMNDSVDDEWYEWMPQAAYPDVG